MFLYFCCRQIRSDICPTHGKDFHPSHRGAMEDQGPGGQGRGHPSFQDPNSQQRDIMSRGEHEGRVPSQNAHARVGRIVLRLCTNQKFPERREGHVGL